MYIYIYIIYRYMYDHWQLSSIVIVKCCSNIAIEAQRPRQPPRSFRRLRRISWEPVQCSHGRSCFKQVFQCYIYICIYVYMYIWYLYYTYLSLKHGNSWKIHHWNSDWSSSNHTEIIQRCGISNTTEDLNIPPKLLACAGSKPGYLGEHQSCW